MLRALVAVIFIALTSPGSARDVIRLLTLPDDRPMPVSIAKFEAGVLVADYLNVSFVAAGNRPRKLDPVFPDGVTPVWQPTGISYFRNKVYVANYVGRNLLIGRVEGQSFIVEREIRDGLVSPENVAASEAGIAAADYDASAILFFEHDGKLRWRVQSANAHGVSIVGEHVYASSLSGDGIQKIRISDGAVVGTSQGSAWSYPTTVFAAPPGSQATVFVVDANAKKIVGLDANLLTVETIEPVGPVIPSRIYGAEAVGSRFLLTDTENERLIWLERGGRTDIAAVFTERRELGIASRSDGARCSTQSVNLEKLLPRRALRAGFGVLCGNDADVILPIRSTLTRRPAQPFGFIWSSRIAMDDGRTLDVLGAANRSIYMVVSDDAYTFVDGDRSLSILGPQGAEAELKGIASRGAARIAAREACGPVAGFIRDGGAKSSLADALGGAVRSEAAKAVVDRWLRGEAISSAEVQDIERQSPLWLEDATIVRMLPSTNAAGEAQKFEACRLPE